MGEGERDAGGLYTHPEQRGSTASTTSGGVSKNSLGGEEAGRGGGRQREESGGRWILVREREAVGRAFSRCDVQCSQSQLSFGWDDRGVSKTVGGDDLRTAEEARRPITTTTVREARFRRSEASCHT